LITKYEFESIQEVLDGSVMQKAKFYDFHVKFLLQEYKALEEENLKNSAKLRKVSRTLGKVIKGIKE
jgi:hypothetical protein